MAVELVPDSDDVLEMFYDFEDIGFGFDVRNGLEFQFAEAEVELVKYLKDGEIDSCLIAVVRSEWFFVPKKTIRVFVEWKDERYKETFVIEKVIEEAKGEVVRHGLWSLYG